ncbi:MAG TPA: hypothetical protein VFJ03_05130 [Candidatus Limnocylindria bacterium]|jgi:hypothetical protein|nr:hypothetical protein [Candidatus Limnocylindria bacterium]
MHLFAYIDPGSGSLLLQAILAAIISIPFFFRRTIGGALSRLRGGVRRRSVDAGPEGSEPSEH